MENKIKGILVGCDDLEEGGYEWVINHNDFDNSNPEIINKLERYKNKKGFKIYFYVFKIPTEEPAKTSDEYRGTIFGGAEIKKVERNKNDPEKYKYKHHVKIKNFEPFEPKIKLEDIEYELEKYGWTEDQKSNFGVNLSHHGLLLTENDCNIINEYVSNNNFNVSDLDDKEDMKMKRREIEIDDDVGNIWFFIANPDLGRWEDVTSWGKIKGHYHWGIPNGNKDLENLRNVQVGDTILCYIAYKRKLIGYCTCELRIYRAEENDIDSDFINRIGISRINEFKNPIKLDKLKQMKLGFIKEYLHAPIGRSIVKVPKGDWEKFRSRVDDMSQDNSNTN